MEITETDLPGVLILTPHRHGDDRGWLSETWNAQTLAAAGIDMAFVQDNHSYSAESGTLRGLHFQTPPMAQDKLVRVARGAIYDVAVDIRRGSPAYGAWTGVELSAENGRQMLVPKGFLHGFVTRQPDTEVLYKCSAHYAPECDRAVRFDSPELNINWQISPKDTVLSSKDASAPLWRDFRSPFEFGD